MRTALPATLSACILIFSAALGICGEKKLAKYFAPLYGESEVRYSVDPNSGEWSLEGPKLNLRSAIASVQVGGKWVGMDSPAKICAVPSVQVGGKWIRMDGPVTVGRNVAVTDVLGKGERRVVTAPVKDGVELSLSVTIYRTGNRAMVEASMRNVGDKTLRVTSFRAFEANVTTLAPARECRALRNSGNQATSGVFALGNKGTHASAYVTCLFDPEARHGLGIGMVSYHRADAAITMREVGTHEVELIASSSFSSLSVPPGGTLSSEAFLLEWGANPLVLLERYADALAMIHDIQVSADRGGFWNSWYAYGEKENSEDHLFNCAEYQSQHLAKWGFPWTFTGIWQRNNAFSEDRVKPDLYHRGMEWLGEQVRKRGGKPLIGGFLARVTDTTLLFQNHPELLVKGPDGGPLQFSKKSWARCPHPQYILDITHPDAQQWYRCLWQSFLGWGYCGYFWIDFEGTTSVGTRHDSYVNAPFETDRLRLKIMREVIGKDAHLASYTSPTNRYVGLTDRVRMAGDVGRFGSGVNWQHIRGVARNMAAAWFYHNRVWVNDPDPPMVGLRVNASRLEEARIRLSIVAMSGGFITLGERMPEMDPAQFRLLSTALPPISQAARPIDLFRNEMPEIQAQSIRTDWDEWQVVSVTNWDDPPKGNALKATAGNGVKPKDISIEFAELGLKQNSSYLLYEFWTQKPLGTVQNRVTLSLLPLTNRILCIRPMRKHPWILSTDLHISQGGVELREVKWHAESATLSGIAERPDLSGSLVIYIPKGFSPKKVQVDGQPVALEQVTEDVVKLPVDFQGKAVAWNIAFY